MGKGNTKTKRRDKYYYLAKEQNFRSRAAFKLIQLNKKHDFLSSARVLIDLCAAPGGWLQVAGKYMPVSSIIIGVDLVPIKPVHNVITLQEDITTPRCRTAIKKHMQHCNADVVICDGAPNMGKAWLQDAYTQVDLVLKALKLATEFLRPGGTFVTKVFRSADYNALLYAFHQLFRKVEATKPPASRNTSAEIYLVCTNYLAPDKIDPRLLDSKHVFKELDLPMKRPDIFAPIKKKVRANQSGYEEGNYTQFKVCSVVEFVEAKDPISVLASYNQMAFDDGARALKLDQHASPEIQACCQDLKVLNKKDFKNLLKWRIRSRKLLHPEEAEEKKKIDDLENVEVKSLSREEMEEQLDKELEDKMSELDKKKKREKKKERQRKAKLRQRVALGMEVPDDGGVLEQESDLFSGGAVIRKDAADLILDQAPDEVLESPVDSEDENEWAGANYDEYLDHTLDSMYASYVERTKKRAPVATENNKKFRMGDDADELPEDERFGGEEDDEDDEEDGEGRRVRFEDGEAKRPGSKGEEKKARQAALWFSRGIFQDVGALEDVEDDESEDEDDDETEIGGRKVKPQSAVESGRGKKRAAEEAEEEEEEEESEDDNEKRKKARKQKQERQEKQASKKQKKSGKLAEEEASVLDEFEVVPLAQSDDDSDSDDAEPESDLDEVAASLAIGKKYFLTKKRKREFEDDAYNRYAFDDRTELPAWFVEDENRHNKPQKPITKEEVEEMKQRFRDLNERPIKKVAEAKARKQLRMMKKVEKMKQKAAKIATADGMSEREKIKSIRTLQKHTLGKSGDANAAPVYIVRKKHQTRGAAKKGPTGGKNAKVKIVDPRLKKDKRGEKRAADKKGRGSGKKRR